MEGRERERDCGKEYGNGLLRRLESQQQPALGSCTVLVIADYLGIWMLVCVYFGNNVLFPVGWLYGYSWLWWRSYEVPSSMHCYWSVSSMYELRPMKLFYQFDCVIGLPNPTLGWSIGIYSAHVQDKSPTTPLHPTNVKPP